MSEQNALPLGAAILPVTPFQQNCTILWESATKRAAVVDPGGEVPRIMAAIAQLGVRVEKIILTHGHIDHAGGVAALREALLAAEGAPEAVPVVGPHQADRFLLESLEKQGAEYGFPDVRNVVPDRWLAEGDTVELGAERFRVLHCPGHSPGSVVLLHDPMHLALVGDVLFRGSIGRTDFPYGDHDALIGAIQTKLLPLGDHWQFICGHGPGSTIGAERRSNPFLR